MAKEPAYHKGCKQAGTAAQFGKPGLAPGQVVGLFPGRLFQQVAGGRIAGDQGLTVVETLGGHLPGMIDPHQGDRLPALTLIQGGACLRVGGPRGGATGPDRGKQGPERPVERDKYLIRRVSEGSMG